MTSVAVIFKGDEQRKVHYYNVRAIEAELFADDEYLYVGDQLVIRKDSIDLVYVTGDGGPMLMLPEYPDSHINIYGSVTNVADTIADAVKQEQDRLW